MRVYQQPAFVLLNRPYSESSWIVELVSRDHGRLAVIAKGARRLKSKLKGVLMPFQPLLVSWTGKGEVPTLTSAEIDQEKYDFLNHDLRGEALVCGFYCNELMSNLMHRHDPHATLFQHYERVIRELAVLTGSREFSKLLREFETELIREVGYGVDFLHQAGSNNAINDEAYYYYAKGKGFVSCSAQHPKAYTGRVISSLHKNEASHIINESDSGQAKALMRDILSQTMGYRAVVSRDLFFSSIQQRTS